MEKEMRKAIAAWKAWQKRLPANETAKHLVEKKYVGDAFVCNDNLCFLIKASNNFSIGVRVPLGRDGLIGGRELLSALLPDGRKMVDVPMLAEAYLKIKHIGEKMGMIVIDA